jgi:5-methylcytosine-specific restriction endonuclease McrA
MAWSLREAPQCGTTRGYDYHTRQLQESPCEPCREAKRQLWRSRRIEKKELINSKNRQRRRQRMRYEVDSATRRKNPEKVINGWSRDMVLETYGTTCHICKATIDLTAPRQVGVPGWESGLHLDHIIPISKGGKDTLENVRPAHAYCNQRKGASC